MLTTSARVAPWAARIAVMLSMMYSAWAAMSLPPTMLPSASMAASPDSCRMVISPSSARATWEYWPTGAGTVAGLSKLTMMGASVGIRGALVASRAVLREELPPSWAEPGRPGIRRMTALGGVLPLDSTPGPASQYARGEKAAVEH